MFSAKLLASTFALFTLASASPALQARACTPNFQGGPLTIFKTESSSTFQWEGTNTVGNHITLTSTSTPFAASEFLVAFSGQPDSSYVFKLTADTPHSVQIQGFASGELSFQKIAFSGNTQNFLISCTTCPGAPDNADGCTIKHVETGLCVTDNAGGSTLTLTTCTGASNQQYNFHSP
jgi:hypothetical protein